MTLRPNEILAPDSKKPVECLEFPYPEAGNRDSRNYNKFYYDLKYAYVMKGEIDVAHNHKP